MIAQSHSSKFKSVRRRKHISHGMAYAILIVLAVMFFFPLFWLVSCSLKTYEGIFLYPPQFPPFPAQFQNYYDALTYKSLPFARFIGNSAMVTVISVLGAVMSSSIVAYSFSRLRWRGRNALFAIVVLTMIIPTEVVITPLYLIYNQMGWIDTYLPMVLPFFFGKAFYVFMIRQTMMGIPLEMDESAKLDGCSALQTFLKIIMPQAKLAIIAVAIMAMQDQWNNYLEPLIYINSLDKQTISVALSYFSGMYQTQWHLVYAAAVMVAMPILILFVFMQKYFIQGVVVSGVKG